MQRLEVSDAVRPLYGSLGVKGLITKGYQGQDRHLMSVTMPQCLFSGLGETLRHIRLANFRAEI